MEDVLTGVPDVGETFGSFGNIAEGIFGTLEDAIGNSYGGVLDAVLVAAASFFGSHPWFDGSPIDILEDLIDTYFPEAGEVIDQLTFAQKVMRLTQKIADIIAELAPEVADFVEAAYDKYKELGDKMREVGRSIGEKIIGFVEAIVGKILRIVEDAINASFENFSDMIGFEGILGIDIGDWSFFDMSFNIYVRPNFRFMEHLFFDLARECILDGRDFETASAIGEYLEYILFAWEISPTLHFDFSVTGFDAAHNDFIDKLFDLLNAGVSFSGHANAVLRLFTLRNLEFVKGSYLDVLEWSFGIRVSVNLGMSLLDILVGGAGGGVLEKLGEFVGLNTIGVNAWFTFEYDIIQDLTNPRSSSLTWLVTMGASISISLDLLVVAASLYGSIEVIISYLRERSEGMVLPIRKGVRTIITLKLKLRFVLWTWKKTWTWEWGQPEDIQVDPSDPEFGRSEMGPDADNDGLSDSFEEKYEGLDPNDADSDNDGVDDYHEVKVMDSCPSDPDSDGDGLTDAEEWDLATNWLEPDTELDGLTDYQEVRIYGTSPFSFDTDGDALSDRYEVTHNWNMTGITPTVEYVTIGGVKFDDHTDPLNPDTDGDSIPDGSEGPMGPYYGLADLYNETPEAGLDPGPLIFNGGYTHPLDADTDDDSYLQLYDGSIDMALMQRLSPVGTQGLEYPMNDGNEIRGFTITLYDDEGEPYEKKVYTNPVNPDSDGDTGVSMAERLSPPAGAWLRSDGYELAQTPPSDPTDGDSDDDGIIDGLEGILREDSNHTFYLDPDTDHDGLPDLTDMLLGTDPLSPDTDLDMIPDGDEFFLFGTNPCLADSDGDMVSDGEEVYIWHTNPHLDDSDGDGLSDGKEIFVTFSDPLDEDGDNDGLTDFEEFRVYGTSPFIYDCDGDLLSDGDEVLLYGTDPLNWDSDYDSITEPDVNGDMTWPMSDYDEIVVYGTDPLHADLDADGLTDAWELYLASGEIPWLDPIPLDPTSNDTDQDLLLDGAELVIENYTDLTFPYLSRGIVYPYNSSPVLQDSDGDTLIDYQEVMVFNTRPDCNDTDGDSLTDFSEVWVFNTSALSADTDGDNLTDSEEAVYEIWPYGPFPPSNWSVGFTSENEPADGDAPLNYSVVYNFTLGSLGHPDPTESIQVARSKVLAQTTFESSATDYDSDGDYLPDGAEVYLYASNPMDPDSDSDGTWDTYEFDTDLDELEDGIEFAIGMQMVPGGGIFNPDSDLDGLLDGVEVYTHKTDPASDDTDGDGYSDGLEVALGLDPLTATTEEEYEDALEGAVAREEAGFVILTPNAFAEVSESAAVVVANFTPFDSMWFRFDNGAGWSDNVSMAYSASKGLWYNENMTWAPGNYTLEVFGEDSLGNIYVQTVSFIVPAAQQPWLWWLLIAAGGVVGFVFITLLGRHQGWWLRQEKEGDSSEEHKEKPEKEEKKKSKSTRPTKKKKTSKKRKKKEGDKE
ncbi:hypothetical protein EU546_00460 [Candidatus Thorarchaeota archaeon]|nr:MAG: hypothetical protein EU546_00460 [Candidatus Thorarchaeota archaeon]